jgi:asparagine synthase (glutamine-hydrolysing)
MCGFFGIFSPKGINFDRAKLESLTKLINHRGPDENGYFVNGNINLGFNRLSIIDIKNGKQPFISQNNRYVIVFNGEIYNYKILRKNLISKNINLKTNSDTEVLLESIANFGLDFIDKINGMFAFVLYDKKENCVYLFRDRLGIKPIFFYSDGSKIMFSSEIKPLISSNLFPKEINYDALSSYLSFRFNYGVGNFFKNINSVEPGEYVKMSANGISNHTYWEYPFNHKKFHLSEKKLIENCEELISEVTSEHLVSDVPVGSLLSGGLDSSLLTVMMDKVSNGKINTFSASFDDKDYDENKFSKIVSNQVKSNHFNIILNSQDYQNNLGKVISHAATPLSIPHEIALNSLFQKISKHSKVVISGEGADEMFGGYGRVQSSGFDYKKIKFVKKFIPKYMQKKLLRLLGSDKDFNWDKYSNQKDHFFDIYKWFDGNEKLDFFHKDVKDQLKKDDKINLFWTNEFDKLKKIDELDKIMFLFQKHHLTCLLHRLDIHSMAYGVEARVPFCDHRIIEFMNRVPYHMKFRWKGSYQKLLGIFNNSFQNSENKDISKYLLRKLSLKYLPNEIAYKKKLGFPVPLDKWLGGSFLNYAKDILLDTRTSSRNIFNTTQIEKLLNNRETINYDFWGKKIWMLINVELWSREFIDKK